MRRPQLTRARLSTLATLALSSSCLRLGAALIVLAAPAFVPRAARAHIKMSAPTDWLVTNNEGDPQKVGPCGVDSTVTYTASNKVTTVHTGDQLTVNWTETVPHDGHFRIALAINSRDELTDPAVTTMNADGTAAAVAISTAYPILADNLFPHMANQVSAGKAYTYTVTIPNTPCAKCTLQLLQFMANHPLDPSYFYHHCADLTILGSGGASGTGGATATGGAGGRSGTGGAGGRSGTGGNTTGTGGNATATGGTVGSTGGTVGSTGGSGGLTGTGGAVSGTGGAGISTGGTNGSGGGGTGGSAVGTGGATTGTGGLATGTGGDTTGTGGGGETGGGGCSCRTAGSGGGLATLSLLGLVLFAARRRRSARR
jgi:MYXO-CTERM domain-containing protein